MQEESILARLLLVLSEFSLAFQKVMHNIKAIRGRLTILAAKNPQYDLERF